MRQRVHYRVTRDAHCWRVTITTAGFSTVVSIATRHAPTLSHHWRWLLHATARKLVDESRGGAAMGFLRVQRPHPRPLSARRSAAAE